MVRFVSSARLRGFLAVVLFCAATIVPHSSTKAPAAASYTGFGDVDQDAYYATAVAWMGSESITHGISPGCFGSDQSVTRAQFVAFLWRAAGRPYVPGTHTFSDVGAEWMTDAVTWAHRNGVTNGVSASRFDPDRGITRGDLITMLWRHAGRPRPATGGQAAAKGVTAGYQIEAVDWALGAGITTPGANFFPDRRTSRAEAAAFLWRYAGSPRVQGDRVGGSCPSSGVTRPTEPPATTFGRCWAAPSGWESYDTLYIPVQGGGFNLDAGRDYRVVFPDQPVTGQVRLHGGRNVVVMGGEISIDTYSSNSSERMGMEIAYQTGVVHLEGLLLGGRWLTEGIQFAAPDAQAVVQNVRIGPISGGNNTDLGLNHADLIQPWGGLGRGKAWGLRICGLSGVSNMNGFFLNDAWGTMGPVDIRYVNIDLVDAPVVEDSEDTGGWHGFFMGAVESVHFEPGTVWVEPNDYRLDGSLRMNLFPYPSPDQVDANGAVFVEYEAARFTGRIYNGIPPGGDFVPAGSVGIGYSPG